MNRDKSMLHEILHGNLSPWLDDSQVDEKYIPMLANIKEPNPSESHKFKLDFPRAFNSKTKYYSRLIRKSINEQVSFYISQLGKETDESVILYLLDEILDKNLKNRIREMGELIREKEYNSGYLKTEYLSGLNDAEHKSNTYIVQLLKLAYIQIYLEVQEEYRQYRDDILHPEDFYFQLLHEPVPAMMPISRNVILEVEETSARAPKKTVSDVPLAISSFTYIHYETGQEKLADVYDKLKSKNFIHRNTTLPHFKKIFSGNTVTNPVRWIATKSDLYYFIRLLYLDYKLLKDLKQKQWEVAAKCFVDEEGNSIDMQKIRLLKKPANTAKQLEVIVRELK